MPVGAEPVDRRKATALLAGMMSAWASPRSLLAQNADKPRRIGVLMARTENDVDGQNQFAALREGLAEFGWAEGRTLIIDTRWTVGDPAKAAAAVQELIALKPDLLVANATPSLIAARQATSSLPIVFVSVADPVGQHFVPSLARPGGNITGFSVEEASLGGKWMEVLKEVAPRTTLVAVIYNPDTAPYAPMFFPTIEVAAGRASTKLRIAPVHDIGGMEYVISATAREPNSALMVLPDSFMFGQRSRLVGLAAEHRIPAIYPLRNYATSGGLIAYGIDRVDLFRRAAAYVDRILKGAAPADLPVQQPTKFEFTINLKTAGALGLTVPQSVLLSAEVIE